MSATRTTKWRLAGACAAAAALFAGVFAGATPVGASPSARPAIRPHDIKVQPKAVSVNTTAAQAIAKKKAKPTAPVFSCQPSPLSDPPRCYNPQQMQAAYNVAPLIKGGLNGSGRTIVIVDAFQNPYMAGDLALFDQVFGLPDPTFTQVAPQGLTPFNPNDKTMVGWAEEITLDVEWAHAIAPGAKIELVLSKSDQDLDIYNATKWAVDHNIGDVISQSFGEAETCVDPNLMTLEHAMFAEAKNKGMTVFASSGDSGAAQFNCSGTAAILAASSPASDPLVTGVGGTTLNASFPAGTYLGETTWTEVFGCNPPATSSTDVNCSGGGFSTIYSRPSFQNGVPHTKSGRGVPDVAYDAGINGGVLAVCSVCNNGVPALFIFGGTSAGSPQWAAITAIGDQMANRRLGDLNPGLYTVSKFGSGYTDAMHDVTAGTNYVSEIGTGYHAAPNWDAVTGLGSPNAAKLLPLLMSMPPA